MKILILFFLIFSFQIDALRWRNNTLNGSWVEITPAFSYLRKSFDAFILPIFPQSSNLLNCQEIKANVNLKKKKKIQNQTKKKKFNRKFR